MKYISLVLVGVVAVSACGSGDEVSVEDAWARTASEAQPNGASYFDLTVDEDDRLVAASVPSDIAARAEIHEVVEADMDMDDSDMSDEMSDDMSDEMSGEMDDTDMSEGSHDMDDMDMGGAMMMREVDGGLSLTGGETVSFEPGGYHIMMLDLAGPLEAGDEFDLTLSFENADDVTVTVEVADEAP